jgi:uncharacterized protein (DUF305 family)
MRGVAQCCVGIATLLAACTAACAPGPAVRAPVRPPILQPGAPGEPTRAITAGEAADLSHIRHTPADVRFMQGMIAHHAQALEMTALRPSRSTREDMRVLALRLELSQADEMKMMRDWLTARGESAPAEHAHHGGQAASANASADTSAPAAALMPGMLSAEEMGRLAAASGTEFDRLFLELMIKHHEGALVMVEQLFATPGAGQEPEMFAFASDVVDDQRIEIDRMARMLKELQK